MTTLAASLSDFATRLCDHIEERARLVLTGTTVSETTDAAFKQLALELFALQFEHNAAYRQICRAAKVTPENVGRWKDIPCVPAAAFKACELTSLPATERTKVFHSSGTTAQQPSRHFHGAESVALYEASLSSWFQIHLLADEVCDARWPVSREKWPFVILTPPPNEAPHSSLVHMFETVRRGFGATDSVFLGTVVADGQWALNLKQALAALHGASDQKRPVILLGTAFSFVHLLDYLVANQAAFQLPPGSRILETGGYKGRSRNLPKSELHTMMTRELGVPPSHIVCEYGMSELSSQAYDAVAGRFQIADFKFQSLPHAFHFPPWARVRIVSPENVAEVADGETGLIQVFDLANVWSVMAVQTEDLGVRRGDGFELVGRAQLAETRGCSLLSV